MKKAKKKSLENLERFSNDGWVLKFDDYSASFEIIDKNIIYTTAQGKFKEKHVKHFFNLLKKVITESHIKNIGHYYRIINWDGFKGSTWHARTLYLKGLKELNKTYPCKFLVVIGMTSFMRPVYNSGRIIAPFGIAVIDNLKEAIWLIKKKQSKENNWFAKLFHKFKTRKSGNSNKLQINNLLDFMGQINWDTDGIDNKERQQDIPPDFLPLYDAISLIKEDFDNILNEKTIAEKKYRTILETINDGYYEVDLKGSLTFFNDALCKIYGYSREELMGMNYKHYTDKKNSVILFKFFNHLYKKGITEKYPPVEWEFIQKNKARISVETSASLIIDNDNNPAGFRGIVRDITERKRTEILKTQKKQAESANKAKSEFLANVSHEIRTPLNAVKGFSELLSSIVEDPKQKSYVDSIKTAGKSLLALINDILDLSKIEAGKLEIKKHPVNLKILFREIEKIFEEGAREKGLKFLTIIDEGLPDKLILDETRLRQVLLNLVGNALKFTDKGHIKLSAKAEHLKGNLINLLILVKDTGQGIHKKDQERIFNAFTQIDGSETKKHTGTGLGLSICKRLIETMNGRIMLLSEKNVGSVFNIVLKNVESKPSDDHPSSLSNNHNVKSSMSKKNAIPHKTAAKKITYNIQNIKRPPELMSILNNEIMVSCKSLEQAIVMGHVKDLSKRLVELGREYNVQQLTDLGDDLIKHAEIFDIVSIEKNMKEIFVFTEQISNELKIQNP